MTKIIRSIKCVWLVGAVGVGLWLSICGAAQADSSNDPTGKDQQYVQYLQNKLSLTSDQTQQIQSIVNNADAQLGPKPDASASRTDRQAYEQKMQQTMQSAQSSISDVLTDQQKTQYTQLHSQQHGQRQGVTDGENNNRSRRGDRSGRGRDGSSESAGQGPHYQWNSSPEDLTTQQPSPNGQRPWHKHRHRQSDQNDGLSTGDQTNQGNSTY